MDTLCFHENIFAILASAKYTVSFKRLLIKHGPKEVRKFLAEACYNLLENNLSFSLTEKTELAKSKQIIRRIPTQRKKADLLNQSFIKVLPTLLKLVHRRKEGK